MTVFRRAARKRSEVEQRAIATERGEAAVQRGAERQPHGLDDGRRREGEQVGDQGQRERHLEPMRADPGGARAAPRPGARRRRPDGPSATIVTPGAPSANTQSRRRRPPAASRMLSFSYGMHSSHTVETLAARIQAAPVLFLLLDYDGTLVPFAADAGPRRARRRADRPAARASRPGRTPRSTSSAGGPGRRSSAGSAPCRSASTPSTASRPALRAPPTWVDRGVPPQDWRPTVLALMRAFAARTPGALVEEKSAGVAWHYRLADPELGAQPGPRPQARAGAPPRPCAAEILRRREGHRGGGPRSPQGPARPVARRARAGGGAARGHRRRPDRRGPLRGAARRAPWRSMSGRSQRRAPIRLGGVPEVRALLRAIAAARAPLTRDALFWT